MFRGRSVRSITPGKAPTKHSMERTGDPSLQHSWRSSRILLVPRISSCHELQSCRNTNPFVKYEFSGRIHFIGFIAGWSLDLQVVRAIHTKHYSSEREVENDTQNPSFNSDLRKSLHCYKAVNIIPRVNILGLFNDLLFLSLASKN